MKELDVVLERYHAQRWAAAPPAERAAFEQLLEQEDPQLWSWIMGQAAPPEPLRDVVERIRRHD